MICPHTSGPEGMSGVSLAQLDQHALDLLTQGTTLFREKGFKTIDFGRFYVILDCQSTVYLW
jgi:hypothetical protein